MRVLITGAAGFIGSNLAIRCLNEGLSTDGVDDLSNGSVTFLPQSWSSSSQFMKCDFADDEVIRRIDGGWYDVVYHLAAIPRVSYSVEHPILTNDVNVTRTLKLLEAVKRARCNFVFASSSSVYGGADVSSGPTSEEHVKNPKSPYALQKLVIEDYLRLYAELYGVKSVALRFFNVFGPHQLGDSPYATAVSAWLSAIKMGNPMRSDGTGEQSRDMCYVDNVVDACRLAQDGPPGNKLFSAYNVACGDRVTNNQIMQYLMNRYPNASKYDAPWRAGDVMHTHADISKISSELGYTPRVKFFDGLDRTISWVERTPEFLTTKLGRC